MQLTWKLSEFGDVTVPGMELRSELYDDIDAKSEEIQRTPLEETGCAVSKYQRNVERDVRPAS